MMFTDDDVRALEQLLQRTPLTRAEALYLVDLMPRLAMVPQVLAGITAGGAQQDRGGQAEPAVGTNCAPTQ